MSPSLLDAYRALAGVAGSDKIKEELKLKAEQLMKECMEVMDKSIEVEKIQITKFSAELNGIIS